MTFFDELKRRNVFRVGIAYVLMGWVLLQAADFAFDLIGAPNWVIQSISVVVVIGLPIALFFAWAFEMTPEGIKREADVDRSQSIAPRTGRKLDLTIIAILLVVIVSMAVERIYFSDVSGPVDTIAVEATAKSIAVLPFADLSQAQDQVWFADGLAEEILNALAKTPDLLVSSRTSSFKYRGTDLDITEIAKDLGVDHVLEGSVRSGDDRIRVTAQLIRASDGFHLWSENYDRDQSDMISIQEDLARHIAEALETSMDPAAMAAMGRVGTNSTQAYKAYLEGNNYRHESFIDPDYLEQVRRSYQSYEDARQIDPEFAAAHFMAAEFWRSQLSPSSAESGLTDLSPKEILSELTERIDLAIFNASDELDKKRYRAARAELGMRHQEATRLYSEYLQERPQDLVVQSYLFEVASTMGNKTILLPLLESWAERGQSDPFFAGMYMNYAYRLIDKNKAADYGLRALERWPDNTSLIYHTHRTLLWAGRVLEASKLADQYLSWNMPDNVFILVRQACAEGRREDAETFWADHQRHGKYSASTNWHVLNLLGRESEADAELRTLVDSGVLYQMTGFISYPQFRMQSFPELAAVLEREGAVIQPPKDIPFKCPPPSQTSVAVLPFVNMSADADNEYFSDGVSEEILNALAAVPELKVAARTSAFAFKGSKQSIAEIATQLGVSHVLEGSVRKAGDQVRITAQLIKADDGFHLWSQTYDRELTNIFTIQDEIAGSIAEMLEVQLLGEQKNFTTTKDLSPETYEKFLKARFLMRRRNDAAMNEAESLSRQVLADAPDFPQGMVQLAEILIQGARQNRDETEAIRDLVSRAIALDPDLPAAHMIQGSLASRNNDILGGIHHLQKAIELDPNEPRPHHWLGIEYAKTGYLEKARQQLQIAVDLEPDHANANGYLGFVLMLQGDFDRARFHYVEQVRLGNMFGSPRLVYIDILTGDLDKARQTAAETDGIDTETHTRMALLINAIEDPSMTSQYLEHIKQPDLDYWHVIQELFLLGLYAESMRLNEEGPSLLMSWADYWSEARALPEFEQILKTRNIYPVWDALGPPPMCRKTRQSYDCRKD